MEHGTQRNLEEWSRANLCAAQRMARIQPRTAHSSHTANAGRHGTEDEHLKSASTTSCDGTSSAELLRFCEHASLHNTFFLRAVAGKQHTRVALTTVVWKLGATVF